MGVRRAAVAGTWYPASPARLTAELDRYLGDVERDEPSLPAGPLALVAPHAGLTYSGPVAAHAYALLMDRPASSIVLVGPSHYVGFEGVSIWPSGSFETPLGALAVDEEISARILEQCPLAAAFPEAHAREHSLEMQLPFIAHLAPSSSIVPVVMGFQTRATVDALAAALAPVLERPDVLVIASSDLSHFYDAGTAAALDALVIGDLAAMDAEALMARLERRPDHACGGGPVVAVMRAAKQAGASRARILEYGDSGDVSGDKSSVVGYVAAAMWR